MRISTRTILKVCRQRFHPPLSSNHLSKRLISSVSSCQFSSLSSGTPLSPQINQFHCQFSTKTMSVPLTPIPRLSPNDPSSFSNPEEVRASNLHLKWTVDFDRKVVSGAVTYDLEVSKPDATRMVFDTRDLTILGVSTSDGQPLQYKIGPPAGTLGCPLTVTLPSPPPKSLSIAYQTSPKSSALLWLAPEQTGGGCHPYLYSHSEAIHARALLPCQDTPSTKATYTAEVAAPSELTVLMSAVRSNPTGNVTKFEQKIPIPSYLIAIVVGHLGSVKIGPRSTVWAEEGFLKAAAYDFSDTEKQLKAGEGIFTPYVWGVYDILVLPPSFPFGGMENPCLTFATPTLLAGDKSLADVIAHEISHSWFGNLVTNRTFEDFWLNEGFTVFAERKILGRLHGEPTRQFSSLCGWKSLQDTINSLGADNPLTCLTPDLTGVDPDDAFSTVPYEKGYTFLYYLEEKVGGAAEFEPFLRAYITTFMNKSISTSDFRAYFTDYFKKAGKGSQIGDIEWDRWLKTPGMPIYKPTYDTSLVDACVTLKNKWTAWDVKVKSPFGPRDLEGMSSNQIWAFLTEFLEDKGSKLGLEKMKALQAAYDLNSRNNSEIRCVWLRLCIKERWLEQVPLALKFITEQGRMKFIRPIYRDLYAWDGEVRQMAIETFRKNQPSMFYVSAYTVAKDLHVPF